MLTMKENSSHSTVAETSVARTSMNVALILTCCGLNSTSYAIAGTGNAFHFTHVVLKGGAKYIAGTMAETSHRLAETVFIDTSNDSQKSNFETYSSNVISYLLETLSYTATFTKITLDAASQAAWFLGETCKTVSEKVVDPLVRTLYKASENPKEEVSPQLKNPKVIEIRQFSSHLKLH